MPTAAALCGEAGKLQTASAGRRKAARALSARGRARFPLKSRSLADGAACRRQLDASDRLPRDFSSGELREPGDDLRAPEVGDLEVDFEALKSVGADASSGRCSQRPRAICLPSAMEALAFASTAPVNFVRTSGDRSSRLVALKLEVASRQSVGANREGAGEPRRSEAERKIVDRPAAVVVSCDMRRALERIAVDISG